MYIYVCVLNRSALRQLNGLTTAIASPITSQCREASTSPKRTITKPVVLCARGGYKASFETCLVDLGGLEKHNFSTALLENSRKRHGRRGSLSILTRLLHSGPFWTGCCHPTAVLNGFSLVHPRIIKSCLSLASCTS